MSDTNKDSPDKIEAIEKMFQDERTDWNEKMREISIRYRNIREVVDVQVDLFSNRQILLERCYKLSSILNKLNTQERKTRAAKLVHYSEKTNVRYGVSEKNVLIDGELSELQQRIDLIDSYLSFLNETMKTIDHILYSIKPRISLEEYYRTGNLKNGG